jgi:hypothetical protein
MHYPVGLFSSNHGTDFILALKMFQFQAKLYPAGLCSPL